MDSAFIISLAISPPPRSFVIFYLVLQLHSFASFHSSHFLLGCLSTFIPPPWHCADWLYVSLSVLVTMVVVEEWEGWKGRWREEALGWRRWRGCHSNKLGQPVAAVLVTVSRIWLSGEGGSGIHQSNPHREGEVIK